MQQTDRVQHTPLHFLIGCRHSNAAVLGQGEVIQNVDQQAARNDVFIEQGMISRLIESKPEELRIFIEEAAGISKYKERRRETESRMRRTLENLDRLSDLREELERNLTFLYRTRPDAVTWAYPVTCEDTGHRVHFDTGEDAFSP